MEKKSTESSVFGFSFSDILAVALHDAGVEMNIDQLRLVRSKMRLFFTGIFYDLAQDVALLPRTSDQKQWELIIKKLHQLFPGDWTD